METPVQNVFTCRTPEELDPVAAELLARIGSPRVVAFYGPLGSGKTTLIKALCRQLGVSDSTASPSFAILYEYRDRDGHPVYHFDFYRLRSESEAFDLGYEDFFYSGCYCFVEWPERVESLLPPGHATVRLDVEPTHRTITYSP